MAVSKASSTKKKVWKLEYRDLSDEQIIVELQLASDEAILDQRRIEEAKIVTQEAMELEVSI